MEVDPVCGKQINAHHAAADTVYEGRTYYFCSEVCKARFDQNPEQYARKEEAA